MRTVKTRIRLGRCPGVSESQLNPKPKSLFLSCRAQIYNIDDYIKGVKKELLVIMAVTFNSFLHVTHHVQVGNLSVQYQDLMSGLISVCKCLCP